MTKRSRGRSVRAAAGLGVLLLACASRAATAGAAPRRDMRIFLFVGHSNMAGRAAPSREFSHNRPHPRTWKYDLSSRPRRWVPASGRMHYDGVGNKRTRGPGVPFLREAARRFDGVHFGIVQNARSQGTVAKYRRGQFLYKEIMVAAKEARRSGTIAGVVCMLGYMESSHRNAARDLARQYTSMIEEVRDELGAPRLPFLLTQFEVGARKKGRHWRDVVKAIEHVGRTVPGVAVISTDGVTYGDDHHFDMAGHVEWAKRTVDVASRSGWIRAAGDAERVASAPASCRRMVSPRAGAVVEAVVTKASKPPTLKSIAPYKHALVCTQWKVRRVVSGTVEASTILTMEYCIRERKYASASRYREGDRRVLRLVPWENRRDLHGISVADDVGDFDSPVYYATAGASRR